MVPVEPISLAVGTTLVVAGLLQPAFKACRDLRRVWKLTQSFGEDFEIARRNFEIQSARLEAYSRRKLGYLKADLNPNDENNIITRAVLQYLGILHSHFEECNNLMEKYQTLGMREYEFHQVIYSVMLNRREFDNPAKQKTLSCQYQMAGKVESKSATRNG